MASLKKLCERYFILFSEKKIKELSELFSDEIVLKDWNIFVAGKKDVLTSIENIFNNVKTIGAYPINYYEEGNTVCCEISIIINDKEKIDAIDVITFDNLIKIKKIKAYKI